MRRANKVLVAEVIEPGQEVRMRRGDYEVILAKVLEAGVIGPGTVNKVDVWHDDRCPLLVRGGRCNCTPEITLTTPAGRFEVRKDGKLVARGVN